MTKTKPHFSRKLLAIPYGLFLFLFVLIPLLIMPLPTETEALP